MALDSVHPLFETTDTFQQLVDHLNYYADNVDSDLRWLDSQIGDTNFLTTENINDPVTKNLVSAINELDSDLFGAGGGSAQNDLNPNIRNRSIVGAINSAFDVFDPLLGTLHFDKDFTIHIQGQNTLSLISDSDIFMISDFDITDGGNIYISTGEVVQFQKQLQDRLSFTFGNHPTKGTNLNTVYSNGMYEVHSKDSVIIRSDANAFSFNNVIDWELYSNEVHSTVHADLFQEINGSYHIEMKDSDDDTLFFIERDLPTLSYDQSIQINLFNNGVQSLATNKIQSTHPLNLEADKVSFFSTEVVNHTGLVTLQDSDDGIYGGFRNNNGFLTIRSNDSDYVHLVTQGSNERVIQLTGSVELPARPTHGSLSYHFDTLGSTKLHDVLEAINQRIPNVYDRNGNILNEMN